MSESIPDGAHLEDVFEGVPVVLHQVGAAREAAEIQKKHGEE